MSPKLTPGEARAIRFMALPISLAAHRLERSESIVKHYWRSIAAKLGAKDTKGAIVLAVRAGFHLEALN